MKPHSKPWIVQLQKDDILHCAGTLIRSELVITAAHCLCQCKTFESDDCLLEVSPNCNIWKQIAVIAGDYDIAHLDKSEQLTLVKQGDVHEKWDGNKKVLDF